jgi:hypothetical protein
VFAFGSMRATDVLEVAELAAAAFSREITDEQAARR